MAQQDLQQLRQQRLELAKRLHNTLATEGGIAALDFVDNEIAINLIRLEREGDMETFKTIQGQLKSLRDFRNALTTPPQKIQE